MWTTDGHAHRDDLHGRLEPGYYTIEAAAWKPEQHGSYTLNFSATPPMLRSAVLGQAGLGPEPPSSRGPSFDPNMDTTLEVAENSPAGTNVGAPVAATHPDGAPLTYSLSGDDAASFAINADTGRITTIASVTYDYRDQVLVLAVSGCRRRQRAVRQYRHTRRDGEPLRPRRGADGELAAEVPWKATMQPGCWPENSPPGTRVGAPFTVFDPNGDALAYAYYDLNGADGTEFAISDDGQLTTVDGVTYDYETKPSYELLVIVGGN